MRGRLPDAVSTPKLGDEDQRRVWGVDWSQSDEDGETTYALYCLGCRTTELFTDFGEALHSMHSCMVGQQAGLGIDHTAQKGRAP